MADAFRDSIQALIDMYLEDELRHFDEMVNQDIGAARTKNHVIYDWMRVITYTKSSSAGYDLGIKINKIISEAEERMIENRDRQQESS